MSLQARTGEKQKVFADVGVGQRRPRAGDTIKGATHRLQPQPSACLGPSAPRPPPLAASHTHMLPRRPLPCSHKALLLLPLCVEGRSHLNGRDPELRGAGLMTLSRYRSIFITGFLYSDNEDNPKAKRCTQECKTQIVLFSLLGGKWNQDAC